MLSHISFYITSFHASFFKSVSNSFSKTVYDLSLMKSSIYLFEFNVPAFARPAQMTLRVGKVAGVTGLVALLVPISRRICWDCV